MNKEIIYIIIFIASVFISSLSQILLKKSANVNYTNKLKEYLNIRVVFAYFLFFVSTLITIYAYKGVPLSSGPILEATGYIFVNILGFVILNEKLNKRKLLGMVLIILGIIIYSIKI